MATKKSRGFTIIELLVALGIGAIVVAASMNMMGGVYFSQKKIQVTHDFSSEVRLLMERITQLVRNNTLDYDRYFIEYGPDSGACAAFDDDQTPEGVGALANNQVNRQTLGYSSIFFWDTGTKDGIPDRNLGGKLPDGVTIDPCTKVQWDADGESSVPILFLINADRNVQTGIRQDGVDPVVARHVQVETRLGVDTNDDGNADTWTPYTEWDGSACDMFQDVAKTIPLVGTFIGEETEDFCAQAHDWVTISPEQIRVDTIGFSPSPDQDPFLSFAVDEAQIHPLVLVFMNATLRNPEEFGMQGDEIPQVSLQTSVSSRVFGNTRE